MIRSKIAARVVSRYLTGKYKAPRKGFPPESEKAAQTLSEKVESRGHDLTQWQQLGGKSGWHANCVNCGIRVNLRKGDYDGFDEYGGLYVDSPNHLRYEKCAPEALELVRGMRVRLPEGSLEQFLAQPPAKISQEILDTITKAGIGASWTSPHNMETAYSYALSHRRGDGDGVPIIIHAEFHRSDQKRSYKPAGFVTLEGFEHEQEIFMNAKEILRITQIDWHDGSAWKHAKVSTKAVAGNWGRDPYEVGFKLLTK